MIGKISANSTGNRGSLISTSGSPENLWKNLAPVYYVHYENVDVEKNAENMLDKFVFENWKILKMRYIMGLRIT